MMMKLSCIYALCSLTLALRLPGDVEIDLHKTEQNRTELKSWGARNEPIGSEVANNHGTPPLAPFHEIPLEFPWKKDSQIGQIRGLTGCDNFVLLTEVITKFQDRWSHKSPPKDIIAYAWPVLESAMKHHVSVHLLHDIDNFQSDHVCRHEKFSAHGGRCAQLTAEGALKFSYFNTTGLFQRNRHLYPHDVRMLAAHRYITENTNIDCLAHVDARDTVVNMDHPHVAFFNLLEKQPTTSLFATRMWDHASLNCEKSKAAFVLPLSLIQTESGSDKCSTVNNFHEFSKTECSHWANCALVGGYRPAMLTYLQQVSSIVECYASSGKKYPFPLDWPVTNFVLRTSFSDVFVFSAEDVLPKENLAAHYQNQSAKELTKIFNENPPPFLMW